MTHTARQPSGKANLLTLTVCVGVVLGMVGLSFAAVPLYRLFCQVTGFGGTTQRASVAPDTILSRQMTILFDANTGGALPWRFEPLQRSVRLQVGERAIVSFRATNESSEPVVGTATFNVTPDKAGAYFNKLQCFCFTEQRLEPGESMDMPVAFFVDPAIDDEALLKDVGTITLSYTFYPAKTPERLSRLDTGADAARVR
ncbi:MAG: cytochrome c oxidase assembly protein [Alphaproteobacteria bacterium]|nr:cytochrome c oxidase assembly protein [Alphaproteobacteria bacterium]